MAIQNRQIGWSQESNLLWQILKQINKLTSVIFGLKEAATPKYKVYTALLTQSGEDDPLTLSSGAVTKGVTYYITDASDGDFSNVGAPSNDDSTWFVAINDEVPNNYGSALLSYNTGAPVVTVLENTIGNIWFEYVSSGNYRMSSNELFTLGKSWSVIGPSDLINNLLYQQIFFNNIYEYDIATFSEGNLTNSLLFNTPIEIRVYN
jgi:hypothetical protein